MNMKPNKEKSIELQLRVIGIFQDTIMQNRWKEYQSLHKRIMNQVIENPEYIDLCDKQRDLEAVISQTLADRANALARERTLADVFDRDQRTKKRMG
jgi:hypothetical protein